MVIVTFCLIVLLKVIFSADNCSNFNDRTNCNSDGYCRWRKYLNTCVEYPCEKRPICDCINSSCYIKFGLCKPKCKILAEQDCLLNKSYCSTYYICSPISFVTPPSSGCGSAAAVVKPITCPTGCSALFYHCLDT